MTTPKRCGDCPLLVEHYCEDGSWWSCMFGLEGPIDLADRSCAVGKILFACHAQRDRARKAETELAVLKVSLSIPKNYFVNREVVEWLLRKDRKP